MRDIITTILLAGVIVLGVRDFTRPAPANLSDLATADDLDGLAARLDDLESRPVVAAAKPYDDTELRTKLAAVKPYDDAALKAAVSKLEAAKPYDDSKIKDVIRRLSAKIDAMSCPAPDPSLRQDINQLQSQVRRLLADSRTCPPPTGPEQPNEPKSVPPKAAGDTSGEIAMRTEAGDWSQDWTRAEFEARRLGRPMLIAFSTTSCPHCDIRNQDVYQSPKVCYRLFRDTQPVWVNVRGTDSREWNLAEQFGVNRFEYPATVIVWPETGSYELFRPAAEPDSFLKQVHDVLAKHQKGK